MNKGIRLKNKMIRFYLKNKGLKFSGLVVDEDNTFIKVIDDRNGMNRLFSRDAISTIEILDNTHSEEE